MPSPSGATPAPPPLQPAGAPSAADATGWFTGFAEASEPAPAVTAGRAPSSPRRSPRPARPAPSGAAAPAARRRRVRPAVVTLAVLALVAGFALVLVRGSGEASSAPALGSGAAWITTFDGAMLVNGATGEPQESVKFACQTKVGICAWRQDERSLVAYERGQAVVHPVDMATLAMLPPVTIGTADNELVLADEAAYAVDHDGKTIRSLDPATFAAAGTVTLDRGVDDAVIDRVGTLYTVEHGTGRIVIVRGRDRGPVIQAGSNGDNLTLGSTSSSVYVLNRTAGTVARIDGDVLRDEVHLTQPLSNTVVVPRSAPDDLAVVVDQASGAITRIDFASQRAEKVGSFTGGTFDGPYVLGTRVFVRDQASNLLHVVDTARHQAEKDIEGVTEVVVKDGYLYANNPQGRGTVVRSDGTRIPIDKGKQADTGGEAAAPKTPAATGQSGPATRKPATKVPARTPAKGPARPKVVPRKVVPKVVPRKPVPRPKPKPRPPVRKPPAAKVAPSTPPKPTAAVAGDVITVTWGPSTGAPASYAVRSDQGQEQTTGVPDCVFANRTCVFHGLAPGTYRFTVTASNAAGSSEASEPSDPATVTSTPPRAPTDVVATYDPAAKVVHVAWVDDDPRVTTYTVIPNDTNADLTQLETTVPASTHDVSFTTAQLTAGKSYQFRVRAAAADGSTGLSSFSNVVNLGAVPGPMGTITVTEPNNGLGATTATLSWAAVADNGSPVTYHVRDQSGNDVGTTTTTSYQYTSLQPGDQTTLTVVPVNDSGAGTGASAQLISYIDLHNGPQPGATINLVADVTETGSGGSYTFTYRIQNGGKAACLPAAVVRIRSAGSPDQLLTVPNICLRAGDQKDITVTATLGAGTYTYAALWSDGASTYAYSNGPTVDHDLVVP